MELLLIQSQEHDTLPIAELRAVLESEEISGEIEIISQGLLILKSIEEDLFDETYKILVKRLAYTHEIDQVIFSKELTDLNSYFDIEEIEGSDITINNINNSCDVLNSVAYDFNNIDWEKYIENDFALRIKRFDNVNIDTIKCERKLGGIIKIASDHFSVNLNNPSSFIRFVVSSSNIYICVRKYDINKKHFYNIKPHKRPFFYPGSMSPKLARCMVNLSKIKEGETLLDPFCGTGGILIEGGLIGAKLIGSDIQWKMKNGTGINLDYCNLKDYELYHLDVRELKLIKKVDAVVTDPPYGISTSTGGEESHIIFHQFLDSISKNMKKDALLCMASPHYLDLDSILNDLDFELLERHHIKMHKSLTRIISVIRKI
ncbi:TIGR01177 family methyltransferase [Methanobrevibacter filiformis]|uniref:tRNA (guanine(10)-N(2))-dimethyltransferase n=1 Tax=Methanobrevibacter filiformis TaxID=55758 RepID=A0A166BKT4_9EURY|nr:TIGR01177 family methyltransferase [Methanobrevibacter filiformis]KZX13499.1 THUMP domain protein [Methanobrevibacter filiformis]